ncbi:MAG: VOC family protein [Actinomycetota bacterium]|nr:VOC family protein [Actinomycetota bacterium]
MSTGPALTQLNFVVRDMDATVAFYRKLGLPVEAAAGAEHVAVHLPNGLLLEFDTVDFVPWWDSGWRGSTGGTTVIGFAVGSRDAVDQTYSEMTSAGYTGHQPPYDGFWGARYAIVDDPDGNPVGIMSPIDDDRKTWPPTAPPRS